MLPVWASIGSTILLIAVASASPLGVNNEEAEKSNENPPAWTLDEIQPREIRSADLRLLRLLSSRDFSNFNNLPLPQNENSFEAARGKRLFSRKRTLGGLLKMVKFGRGANWYPIGVAAIGQQPFGGTRKDPDFNILSRGKKSKYTDTWTGDQPSPALNVEY